MKKSYLFLVFIFIAHLSFGQVKSGKITYKISDILNKNKILKKAAEKDDPGLLEYTKNSLQRRAKSFPYLTFTLTFNTRESLFERQPTLTNDNGINLNLTAKIVAFGDGVYYTDLPNRLQVHQMEFGKKWLIKSSLDSLHWKLSEETRAIKGYLCKKATAVYHYNKNKDIQVTAWYCPRIPFQFGPLNYAGLPGLILGLSIKDNGVYFYADKIKLSKREKNIKKPTEGTTISKKMFFKKAIEAMHKKN